MQVWYNVSIICKYRVQYIWGVWSSSSCRSIYVLEEEATPNGLDEFIPSAIHIWTTAAPGVPVNVRKIIVTQDQIMWEYFVSNFFDKRIA